jgi:hypothetical protein
MELTLVLWCDTVRRFEREGRRGIYKPKCDEKFDEACKGKLGRK